MLGSLGRKLKSGRGCLCPPGPAAPAAPAPCWSVEAVGPTSPRGPPVAAAAAAAADAPKGRGILGGAGGTGGGGGGGGGRMPENRLAGGTCGGLTGCVMGVVRGGGGPGRGCRGRCCCLCDPPLPPPWPGGGGGGCRVPGEGSGACSWSEKGSKPRMFPAPPFRTNEHCVLQMLSLLTASWPNSNTSWRQLLIFKDWHWAWNKTISLLLLFFSAFPIANYPFFRACATGARRDLPGGSYGDVEPVHPALRDLLPPVGEVEVGDGVTGDAGIPMVFNINSITLLRHVNLK